MASKKAGAAAKSKKPETPDSSSEEEKASKPPTRPKGAMQKKKSSDKLEEKKSKPMPPNPKKAQGKSAKEPVDSDSESDDIDYAPPKRALSAYNFYSSAIRPEIIELYPDAAGREIMGLIGKHWKKTTDSEKAEYIKMAEKDKARRERQMEEFETHGKFYDEEGKVVQINKKKKRSMSKKKTMEKKKPMKKNK